MNNRYEVRGKNTVIFLTYKGQQITTIISTEDLRRVSLISGRWYAMNVGGKDNEKVYVGSRIGGVTVYLHQVIADNPPKTLVDHMNHNTLDNTRDNLNVVDRVKNGQNRKGATKGNRSSGLRNVYKNACGNWFVQLYKNGKYLHFGTYKTIELANKVAIEARKAHYYGSENINFEKEGVS